MEYKGTILLIAQTRTDIVLLTMPRKEAIIQKKEEIEKYPRAV